MKNVRCQIVVPAEVRDQLKAIGNGSVSEGLRYCIYRSAMVEWPLTKRELSKLGFKFKN